MPADTVQMQLIRRYARILREQQAKSVGPRIGARERRLAKDAASAAIAAVKPPERPAV